MTAPAGTPSGSYLLTITATGGKVTRSATLALAVVPSAPSSWALAWSDEFNSAQGSLPAPANWSYDLGNWGWGNHELQNFTNSPVNAHMDGQGNLAIHAESSAGGYTSAQLNTKGKFSAQYGRVVARMKLPVGAGLWPAFWMMGANIDSVGWPQCGEVDIMESRGDQPSANYGSIHGPRYSGGGAIQGIYVLPNGAKFSDDFHEFALEWSPQTAVFYLDGTPYQTTTKAMLPAGSSWVFDQPFYLLLSLAVGGDFPGSPDASTSFPQELLVDYVRVYRAAN